MSVWIGGREVKKSAASDARRYGGVIYEEFLHELRRHKGSKYTERCRRMTMWSAQSCLRLRC